MQISPLQARIALASFLLIAAATAANMLYLQDPSLVSKGARAQAERAKARAELERMRRLAIDEAQPAAAASAVATRKVDTPAPALTPVKARSELASAGGIGRFAPAAGSLELANAIVVGSEGRMPDIVRAIQAALAQRGYEPGVADGVVGLATRAAILAYEHDQGLPLTAEPAEHLLLHLQGRPLALPPSARANRPSRTPHLEALVRTVQQSLSGLGYFSGKIDGIGGEETTRAIREYEMDHGLVPTGRISAPLINRLARASATPRSGQR
jgi:peptidoglycan hydrolase-like protein with peptidoglycan-binding domain